MSYTNLLAHLHRPTPSLPLETIQGALSHHLAHLEPLPTPLAAVAISSPLFASLDRLPTLSTSFRHAVHIKYLALKDEPSPSLFSRSMQTRMRQWVSAVMKGIQGGQSALRLASCGGVLLGLEDLWVKEKFAVGNRAHVEDETVVALAEVMDLYGYSPESPQWESEWQKTFEPGEVDVLSLALVLASDILPLVSPDKAKALSLGDLSHMLSNTITSAFASGRFLSTLPSVQDLHIPETSPLVQSIHSVQSSHLMKSVAPLSKLAALILSLLLESRPKDGLHAAEEMLRTLEDMSRNVESAWKGSVLANAKDVDIPPESSEVTKSIWLLLKTMLFSIIMVSDAILTGVVYVPPSIYASPALFSISHLSLATSPSSTTTEPTPTPKSLSLQALRTLSHLSFVISQFGGVGTASAGSEGFRELKKTFYVAVDILADGTKNPSEKQEVNAAGEAERFMLELCLADSGPATDIFGQAKKAFTLGCAEQLVPALSAACIQRDVIPLCLPHLNDSPNRETFESAHSVVLAVFAAHANNANNGDAFRQRSGAGAPAMKQGTQQESSFTARMVPFYAKCLIENSEDGKLNTSQLRLAFAALVRGAAASAPTAAPSGESAAQYALAWYCISELLDAIQQERDAQMGKSADPGRLHRMHLMLVACISVVPLGLLERVLESARAVVVASGGAPNGHAGDKDRVERKEELVEEIFGEIMEKAGDREKEVALQWWFRCRDDFGGTPGEEKKGKSQKENVARL